MRQLLQQCQPVGLHRLHEFRIILGRQSQPSQFGQRTLSVIGGRHLIRVQSLARHPDLLDPQPVGIQSDRLSDDFLTKLPFIGDQLRMSGGPPFEQHPDGQLQREWEELASLYGGNRHASAAETP